MNLVKLEDIDKDRKFWKGERFRVQGVGMTVPDNGMDFYDYMLVDLPWESSYLFLINVTSGNNKAGSLMAAVETTGASDTKCINREGLTNAIGEVGVFYIEE
ncbi:hypothetical protein [Chryseolinea lacunae]|uniref:Uncharacterized protein n=1 Tax=Chryseolinea lacunae TaxID=2801331 RepID=A0ABS1KZB0_9BACT|nr:hypothetical protein [Chryseolinea lacunae]MBL0744798.1 hypothetical protein [Chryseolinea lacunae]